jgi:hypothetical protein
MLERIKKWIMSAFANTAEAKEFKEMVIEEELPVEVVEESTEKNEPIEDDVVPKKPKRKYNKKKKANGNESK